MKGLMLAAFAISAGLFAGGSGTQTASAMVLSAVGTSTEAIAKAPVTKVQYPPWYGHPRAGWRRGYVWRPGYGWVAPAVVGGVIAGAAIGAAAAGAPPPPPPPGPYPYYGPSPYYGPRY